MAKKLGERVITIHASDNDGKRDDHLIPGMGGVDWVRFGKILREIRYDSVFMVELRFLSPARVVAWAVRKFRDKVE